MTLKECLQEVKLLQMFCRADWRTRARIRIEAWDDFHFLDIQEQSRCEINILLMREISKAATNDKETT